jgi:hypothetical protein
VEKPQRRVSPTTQIILTPLAVTIKKGRLEFILPPFF